MSLQFKKMGGTFSPFKKMGGTFAPTFSPTKLMGGTYLVNLSALYCVSGLIVCVCSLFGGVVFAQGNSKLTQSVTQSTDVWTGDWTAELRIDQHHLPFRLELESAPTGLQGWFLNGDERIQIESLEAKGDRLTIHIPHYQSRIDVRLHMEKPKSASGIWKKRRGLDHWAEVPITIRESQPTYFDDPQRFLGRWAVRFADSPIPAVAVFEKVSGTKQVGGTFLTTTGDYRYLAGGVRDGRLKLSCFDGAHAFLFHAVLDENGGIKGDFYSGNWYHTTWQATLNANAKLPDAFQQTHWTGNLPLDELSFTDLDGNKISLGDPSLSGTCRIIELFGSWCPNCHDAGSYLSELHQKYKSQGLTIVGLAFEITGEFEQDVQQVRKFAARNQVAYPILIAGTADKELASKAMPVLDRVKSFPTFIFLNARGDVLAIYTGFSGPATGQAYQQLQDHFEAIVRKGLELE